MTRIDVNAFHATLYSEIGKPYVYGDEGPNTFDCSGLTQFVFGKFGVTLPRTAHEQQVFCTKVTSPNPYDLVFYGPMGKAHHVGIYVGNGKMVDAPDRNLKVREEGVGIVASVPGAGNYGRVPGVEWVMGSGGVVDPSIAGPVVDKTISAAVSSADTLAHFVGALTNSNTWLRIGEVVLGLVLVAVGTAKLTSAVPIVNKVAKAVR